jgi:hypothetical protein
MQWWNKHYVEKENKKWWMKGGETKSNMQMVEEGQKMKSEITTSLFSRWEHHILGLWARPSPYLKIWVTGGTGELVTAGVAEGLEKMTRGGVNGSQSKFLDRTRPISQKWPDAPLL